MAVFASRQIIIPVLSVVVTTTGKGNSEYCYATINGKNVYGEGTYEVNRGDTITFCVIGFGNNPGWVEIDGTQVLQATGSSQKTYDWTVPDGTSTVKIKFYINMLGSITGRITVTTA